MLSARIGLQLEKSEHNQIYIYFLFVKFAAWCIIQSSQFYSKPVYMFKTKVAFLEGRLFSNQSELFQYFLLL